MRDDQWDRLMNLLERYVVIEETKLRVGLEGIEAQRARDERAVAATEKLGKIADGMKVEHVQGSPE